VAKLSSAAIHEAADYQNRGVTEFMVMVTGIREPARKLTFRGMRVS
jgi:hypothetical protein